MEFHLAIELADMIDDKRNAAKTELYIDFESEFKMDLRSITTRDRDDAIAVQCT